MSNIVTFEQAKELKEFGFNRECIYWYNENGTKECPIEQGYMEYYYEVDCFLNDWNAKKIDRDLYGSYPPKVSYSAPTVSEALDYLREEKGIYCSVNLKVKGYTKISIDTKLRTNIRYYYYVFNDISRGAICSESKDKFDTHPLASSALLTAVLDYLEKKGGEG